MHAALDVAGYAHKDEVVGLLLLGRLHRSLGAPLTSRSASQRSLRTSPPGSTRTRSRTLEARVGSSTGGRRRTTTRPEPSPRSSPEASTSRCAASGSASSSASETCRRRCSRRSRASWSCSRATARSAIATPTTRASARTARSASRSAGRTPSWSGVRFSISSWRTTTGARRERSPPRPAAFRPTRSSRSSRRADGARRAFAWAAVPIADVTGRTDGLVLVSGMDVTERRRLEDEKERERVFLNAIANNAPSLLCLVDHEGVITERGANIAFERTLEYDPSEIGGQVFWEAFVDPAEADQVRETIMRIAGGEPPAEHDNTWMTKTGRRLSMAWTCTPLPVMDERTLFLITAVDISERRAERRGAARIAHATGASRGDGAARPRAKPARRRTAAARRAVGLTPPARVEDRERPRGGTGAARGRADGARADPRGAAGARARNPSRRTHGPWPPAGARDARVSSADPGRPRRARGAASPGRRGGRVLRRRRVADQRGEVRPSVSTASVSVQPANGVLVVTVSDDGVGGADPFKGSGLRGLADRVSVLDGTLSIESPQEAGDVDPRRDPARRIGREIHSKRCAACRPEPSPSSSPTSKDRPRCKQDPRVDYAESITLLRRLLRDAVATHGGAETDAVGDEYVAAFADRSCGRGCGVHRATCAEGCTVAEPGGGTRADRSARRHAGPRRRGLYGRRRRARVTHRERRPRRADRRFGRDARRAPRNPRAATSESIGWRGSRGRSASTSSSPTTFHATSRPCGTPSRCSERASAWCSPTTRSCCGRGSLDC